MPGDLHSALAQIITTWLWITRSLEWYSIILNKEFIWGAGKKPTQTMYYNAIMKTITLYSNKKRTGNKKDILSFVVFNTKSK